MSHFGKKFKRVGEENLDALTAETKSATGSLKMISDAVHSFTDNGNGSYTYVLEGSFGKWEQTFKNGEKIKQANREGVPQTISFNVNGDVVTQTIEKEGNVITYLQEYDGNKMTMTISVSGTKTTAKIFHEVA